ncbi:hypothetical protein [Acetobacter papayae]|uniref:hypothetical protein n=1 Tax=Acetobacter papayae TaxID=1076592 RepID=UPI000ABBF4FA|nr:hypothetical protein [Acetobacter papayae]
MLAVLSFAGGVTGTGRQGLACVLAALGLLALSPLVFCLLAGTALALLTRRGGWGLCLPFAVLPACVPADSVLSVPLLALSILQTGHAVGEQKGPVAMVPAFIGIFLLGRLLAETGAVPFVQQALMLACGGWVAWRGGLQALRGQQSWCVASGLAGAWYGGAVWCSYLRWPAHWMVPMRLVRPCGWPWGARSGAGGLVMAECFHARARQCGAGVRNGAGMGPLGLVGHNAPGFGHAAAGRF